MPLLQLLVTELLGVLEGHHMVCAAWLLLWSFYCRGRLDLLLVYTGAMGVLDVGNGKGRHPRFKLRGCRPSQSTRSSAFVKAWP